MSIAEFAIFVANNDLLAIAVILACTISIKRQISRDVDGVVKKAIDKAFAAIRDAHKK